MSKESILPYIQSIVKIHQVFLNYKLCLSFACILYNTALYEHNKTLLISARCCLRKEDVYWSVKSLLGRFSLSQWIIIEKLLVFVSRPFFLLVLSIGWLCYYVHMLLLTDCNLRFVKNTCSLHGQAIKESRLLSVYFIVVEAAARCHRKLCKHRCKISVLHCTQFTLHTEGIIRWLIIQDSQIVLHAEKSVLVVSVTWIDL